MTTVLLTMTGCVTQEHIRSRARDHAVDTVREQARHAQEQTAAELAGDPDGRDVPALVARLRTSLDQAVGPGGSVLSAASAADGTIRADLTFVAIGEAGGAGSSASVTVRLCATVEGRPAPRPVASLRDLPCPSNAPTRPGYQSIDEVVTLSD
ncbi:hypothetical protein [Krasilnikovia sp. MM14-A1004]|uniref:hypothetical protein n=1 Tax=Krasilnikovia sp. MM14-A1004 TaxID=3373541 RepID=UPI00399C4EC4